MQAWIRTTRVSKTLHKLLIKSLYLTKLVAYSEKNQKKGKRKSNELDDVEERLLPNGKFSQEMQSEYSASVYLFVLMCYPVSQKLQANRLKKERLPLSTIRISSSWSAKKSTQCRNKLVKTKLRRKRTLSTAVTVTRKLMRIQRKSSRSLTSTRLTCSELKVCQL